jgi:hypothetical protein
MESCAMKRLGGVYTAVDQNLTFVQRIISLRAGRPGTAELGEDKSRGTNMRFVNYTPRDISRGVTQFIVAVEAGVYRALYFGVIDPSSWNSRLPFETAPIPVVVMEVMAVMAVSGRIAEKGKLVPVPLHHISHLCPELSKRRFFSVDLSQEPLPSVLEIINSPAIFFSRINKIYDFLTRMQVSH